MIKEKIKQIVEKAVPENGMVESGIAGVQLFRFTSPLQCAPAIYEPSVIAIVSGAKEAILEGESFIYDHSRYMCCSMSMPVEAGIRSASPDNPLVGVYISMDTRVMTELAIELENATGAIRTPKGSTVPKGMALAHWDEGFTEALFRLLKLSTSPEDSHVLGAGRLRELYYAVLKGEAGDSARRAFGVGNEIARAIEYMSARINEVVTIDDMASQVGMSRAVLHRKFKQATSMSPIQFVKSMRLNKAAMNIAEGMSINEASMAVGYISSSQFSREFKRMYGQSPKQWSHSNQLPTIN